MARASDRIPDFRHVPLLRLRGLRFTARSLDALSPIQLMRIDVCWSVAGVLSQTERSLIGVNALWLGDYRF